MIDTNFILNNPEKFNIAMASRSCKIKAEEIIHLHNIEKKQKQITEIENSLKKLKAKIFVFEKRKANKPLDKISEEYELKKTLIEIQFNYAELLGEEFDARVNYIKYKDNEEQELFKTHGIELPNYWN